MYYFIAKFPEVNARPATLLLAGYCDIAGTKHPYWHEESILHPETERFEDAEEAKERAERVGGRVCGILKSVYHWLIEQKKLDEEEANAAVSC
jgi:hypothetical protein